MVPSSDSKDCRHGWHCGPCVMAGSQWKRRHKEPDANCEPQGVQDADYSSV